MHAFDISCIISNLYYSKESQIFAERRGKMLWNNYLSVKNDISRSVQCLKIDFMDRAVARALTGGWGVYSYIFVLCPTNFF